MTIFGGTRRTLFVDCTVGAGGHSYFILRQFPQARVLGLDVDGESLRLAANRLAEFSGRVHFVQSNFLRLFEDVACEWDAVAGLLVDPGISQWQLRDASRGFSHSLEGGLDMRKDLNCGPTAEEVLNSYSEAQLADLFQRYGEVKKSAAIAKRIIERRLFEPLRSALQLRTIVEKVYRWRPKPGRLHPAAQVFQALRIHVNRELEGLEEWLKKIPRCLRTGARLVFISYHSLEDRLVKRTFQLLARDGSLRLLKPFPRLPSASEVRENSASRSARLRAAEVA